MDQPDNNLRGRKSQKMQNLATCSTRCTSLAGLILQVAKTRQTRPAGKYARTYQETEKPVVCLRDTGVAVQRRLIETQKFITVSERKRLSFFSSSCCLDRICTRTGARPCSCQTSPDERKVQTKKGGLQSVRTSCFQDQGCGIFYNQVLCCTLFFFFWQ